MRAYLEENPAAQAIRVLLFACWPGFWLPSAHLVSCLRHTRAGAGDLRSDVPVIEFFFGTNHISGTLHFVHTADHPLAQSLARSFTQAATESDLEERTVIKQQLLMHRNRNRRVLADLPEGIEKTVKNQGKAAKRNGVLGPLGRQPVGQLLEAAALAHLGVQPIAHLPQPIAALLAVLGSYSRLVRPRPRLFPDSK